MTNQQDTIFALSSGHGTAGVAVVRLSGPKADEALAGLTPNKKLPEPRVATLRTLVDPYSKARLDKALVLRFVAPASFTGEDCVELHLHGGRAVVAGVIEALSSIKGLRPAEAGEFSRRAFDEGKLDLTEAEALNDLIHAQTAAQREQALRQMDGGLRDIYENWRSRLLGYLAHLEADIDFPDEDLPEGVSGAVLPNILQLKNEIAQHIDDGRRGRMLRDGCKVVILGAPNVGKSTLLNALAHSDVAIVSEEAGTTRDSLEVVLDIGGFPVRLIDTAGVRETDDTIEKEGVRRALSRANEADLKLVLVRADVWPDVPENILGRIDHDATIVITQIDRGESWDRAMFHVEHLGLDCEGVSQPILVSVKTGDHMATLMQELESAVRDRMALKEAPSLTRLRHQQALQGAQEHLDRFGENAGTDAVLAAEDVRMAVRSIGRITGRVGVEDMLDIVFGDFCIGK